MNEQELKKDVESGLSSREIAKKHCLSQTAIRYWCKKFHIPLKKTNKSSKQKCKTFNKEDIEKIRNDYCVELLTWKQIAKKRSICLRTLNKLLKKHGIMGLNQSQKKAKKKKTFFHKQTEETRKKLSKIRKHFLLEKGVNAWHFQTKNHFSWACEEVKKCLKKLNLEFKEEHQPILHLKRFFSLDIAFVKEKVAIEINGRQHYDPDGTLKPYFQKRHNLIESDGWIILELPYSKNIESLMEKILFFLNTQGVKTSPIV